jgi:alpha-1,3-rhamnosyl/mannosyltransferase
MKTAGSQYCAEHTAARTDPPPQPRTGSAGDPPSREGTERAGLRIGIDATCLGSGRGYGRFLRELLPPLLEDPDNEYILFVDSHTAEQLDPLPARCVTPSTSQAQGDAASARGQRKLGDMWRMGRAVANEQLDVMYFPSVYSYYPVPGRTPVAVAFHDVIAERHGAVVFPTRWNRWMWGAKARLARRRARALITVSEWSRRALSELFGTPIDEIYVTLEAPSPAFRPAPETETRRHWLKDRDLPEGADYFIFVGGFNPHKNLPALIDCFAEVAQTRPNLHLILVGDYEGDVFHIDVEALLARIAMHGLERRAILAGFVPDEALRHLFTGARALVIPSLEEGFGLPAVEAAACGTPCIATTQSPLPELLEGGGLFVDPDDRAGLTRAMAQLADDEEARRALGAAALECARALSWRATAEATRKALTAVATQRGGRS